MRCRNARILISRGIDGKLPMADNASVQRHLEKCPDCAHYAERCRALQRLIGQSVAPAADRSYWAELSARVAVAAAQDGAQTAPGLRLSRLISCLAAGACLILFVMLLGERSRVAQLRRETARGALTSTTTTTDLYGFDTSAVLISHAQQPEPTEQRAAFEALGDYYQGELGWMVQDGAQTALGVSVYPSAREVAAKEEALLVGIAVVTVTADRGPRLISAPTLMILPGAEANFRLAETGGTGPRRLRYQCAYERGAAADGLVEVALEITPLLDGKAVKLSGAVTPGDRTTRPVAYNRVGDAHYALFVSTYERGEPPPSGDQA